ncbi:MAG: methionyl-tRNA formyltransferase [Bacteroidia bacterium]|nr:MAG: methionyl-tRNA formyltransferase [Bacteroidia bacterium]
MKSKLLIMHKPLKIAFAGTPLIASTVLQSLIDANFPITLVLTQPDRQSGRGLKITESPVKTLAKQHQIPVLQPQSFKNDPELLARITESKPDILVVIAYGMILPQSLLTIPPLGAINIHVSLLPKLRGAAPIQRAIINGDTKTGVTIMQMDDGLDTGAILIQEAIPILSIDNSQTLAEKLAILGAKLVITYLTNYSDFKPQIQNSENATYAHKINKIEALINWNESAIIIARKIKAFNPNPGAFSHLDSQIVKIWDATVIIDNSSDAPYGKIISYNEDGIHVAAGDNTILIIKTLQIAGKKMQAASQFAKCHRDILNLQFS